MKLTFLKENYNSKVIVEKYDNELDRIQSQQLEETAIGTLGGAIGGWVHGANNAKGLFSIDDKIGGAVRGALIGNGATNMIAGKGSNSSNLAQIGAGLAGGNPIKMGAAAAGGALLGKGVDKLTGGASVKDAVTNLAKNGMSSIANSNNFSANGNSIADKMRQKLFATHESLNESADSVDFKAFITNLGKYNDGELIGEWVNFPIDEDEFNKILDKIGIDDQNEEWFVTDYDCDIDAYNFLGEYPSLDDLNEFGKLVEDNAFKAILDASGNFNTAKDIYERRAYTFFPDEDDWTEFAQHYIDETGGVESLDEDSIEEYFDYEALGRDLSFDDYDGQSAGEYWCGDEYASDEEIGEAFVEAVGFAGVANPENYFDYEQFGRTLSFDYTMTDYGVVYI